MVVMGKKARLRGEFRVHREPADPTGPLKLVMEIPHWDQMNRHL